MSADAPQHRALVQALRARHPTLQAETDAANIDWRKSQAPVITLGPQALRKALDADSHAPLVAALTSSQLYRRLTGADPRDRNACGIFAEASPLAQMQLISALFERHVTVGVLLSEASGHLDKLLRQAASQTGHDIQIAYAAAGQEAVRSINALPAAQVLLAVPDNALYTPDTLRSVLESTYRRGLPVIGFSAAMVNAGTLAAAHADIEDIVTDLLDLLDTLPPAGSPPPEARYPRYWRVAINDNVARSFGLLVSDKARALGNRPGGRSA
jgi:ABC-type uncharacterized transport system substrate-binding protein